MVKVDRKIFKFASALMLLVLYISTVLAGDVMSLTCGCRHHDADVHTAFRHVHKCTSSCCKQSVVAHSHECDAPKVKESGCCNHNHSTDIKLYVQPRVDDGQLRQTILLAVLMDTAVTLDAPDNVLSFVYQEHRQPVLAAGYGGGQSLRAPPAIV